MSLYIFQPFCFSAGMLPCLNHMVVSPCQNSRQQRKNIFIKSYYIMSLRRLALISAILMIVPNVVFAKGNPGDDEKKEKSKTSSIYMFGIGAAFGDSIVYVTDVNRVDSVVYDKKTGYLKDRANYSIQLKDYLENKLGLEKRTCAVFYSDNKAKIDKKHQKLLKTYSSGSTSSVKKLSVDEFRYVCVKDE